MEQLFLFASHPERTKKKEGMSLLVVRILHLRRIVPRGERADDGCHAIQKIVTERNKVFQGRERVRNRDTIFLGVGTQPIKMAIY
jgi:hypothetical protein